MDRPATPVEKFLGMEAHYRATGKAFDPDLVKKTLIAGYVAEKGWPEDHPALVQMVRLNLSPMPADPARVKREKLSDREAAQALAASKEKAIAVATERATLPMSSEELAAENEKLRAMLAGEDDSAVVFSDDDADLPVSEADLPAAEMREWPKRRILEWADAHDMEPPKDLAKYRAKADLIEWIFNQLKKEE